MMSHESSLVNAPRGCGKTYFVFLGAIIDFINHHPHDYKTKSKNVRPYKRVGESLQLLWITPLRGQIKVISPASISS